MHLVVASSVFLPIIQAVTTILVPSLLEPSPAADIFIPEEFLLDQPQRSLDEHLLNLYQSVMQKVAQKVKSFFSPTLVPTWTPLEHMIRKPSIKDLTALLEKNIYVDEIMSNGQHAVMFAAVSEFKSVEKFKLLHSELVEQFVNFKGRKLENLRLVTEFNPVSNIPGYYTCKDQTLWTLDLKDSRSLKEKFSDYAEAAIIEAIYGNEPIRVLVRNPGTQESFIAKKVLSYESALEFKQSKSRDPVKTAKLIKKKLRDIKTYIGYVSTLSILEQDELYNKAQSDPKPLQEQINLITFDVNAFEMQFNIEVQNKKHDKLHAPIIGLSKDVINKAILQAYSIIESPPLKPNQVQEQVEVERPIIIESMPLGGWRARY